MPRLPRRLGNLSYWDISNRYRLLLRSSEIPQQPLTELQVDPRWQGLSTLTLVTVTVKQTAMGRNWK